MANSDAQVVLDQNLAKLNVLFDAVCDTSASIEQIVSATNTTAKQLATLVAEFLANAARHHEADKQSQLLMSWTQGVTVKSSPEPICGYAAFCDLVNQVVTTAMPSALATELKPANTKAAVALLLKHWRTAGIPAFSKTLGLNSTDIWRINGAVCRDIRLKHDQLLAEFTRINADAAIASNGRPNGSRDRRPSNRKRGGQVRYDRKADQRIYCGWRNRGGKFSDYARELGKPEEDVKRAIDRARKRK